MLPTFTAKQIRCLSRGSQRGDVSDGCILIMLLLGNRSTITEALTLRVSDVDMENLLITRDGKGRKRRIVLFSFERRKVPFRYVSDYKRKADLLLLARRNETLPGRRVMVRDMKRLCKRLGFDPPVADPAHFQTFFCRELPSLRRECVPFAEGARSQFAGDDAEEREPAHRGSAGGPRAHYVASEGRVIGLRASGAAFKNRQ